jgi:hypothetical protein
LSLRSKPLDSFSRGCSGKALGGSGLGALVGRALNVLLRIFVASL